jgi:hypothetical protein
MAATIKNWASDTVMTVPLPLGTRGLQRPGSNSLPRCDHADLYRLGKLYQEKAGLDIISDGRVHGDNYADQAVYHYFRCMGYNLHGGHLGCTQALSSRRSNGAAGWPSVSGRPPISSTVLISRRGARGSSNLVKAAPKELHYENALIVADGA